MLKTVAESIVSANPFMVQTLISTPLILLYKKKNLKVHCTKFYTNFKNKILQIFAYVC